MKIIYKPKYFMPHEFTCKCGCGFCEPAVGLVLALEFLRRAWGQPIYINSGCRCEAHNRAISGAVRSRHMAGLAADIRPRDIKLMSPLFSLVSSTFEGLPNFEIKPALTYIHFAVPRGNWSIWDGNGIYINV